MEKDKLIEDYKAKTILLNTISEKLSQKKKAFEKEILDGIESKKTLEGDLKALKKDLETLAIKSFKETGDKKFEAGIKIAESSIAEYDLTEALNWSKTNAKIFVKETLDTKAFEKHCKGLKEGDNLRPGFIKITKVFKAQYGKIDG